MIEPPIVETNNFWGQIEWITGACWVVAGVVLVIVWRIAVKVTKLSIEAEDGKIDRQNIHGRITKLREEVHLDVRQAVHELRNELQTIVANSAKSEDIKRLEAHLVRQDDSLDRRVNSILDILLRRNGSGGAK